MKIACISLEGVLAPHIWEEVAHIADIPDLIDEDGTSLDYFGAMKRRIAILRRHGVSYDDFQFIVSMLRYPKGVLSFLRALRKEYYVIVVADTFLEIAMQFTGHLGYPVVKAHHAHTDACGFLDEGCFSMDYDKEAVVDLYNKLGHQTLVIGHSVHDLAMIRKAASGCLYCPTKATQLLGWGLPVFYELGDISEHAITPRPYRHLPRDRQLNHLRF
jgi:bifunctional phosphoserine phosphatase/homoserine phosphotransferase